MGERAKGREGESKMFRPLAHSPLRRLADLPLTRNPRRRNRPNLNWSETQVYCLEYISPALR